MSVKDITITFKNAEESLLDLLAADAITKINGQAVMTDDEWFNERIRYLIHRKLEKGRQQRKINELIPNDDMVTVILKGVAQ